MDRSRAEAGESAVYPITLGNAFRAVVTALGVFYLIVAALAVLDMAGLDFVGDLPFWATYVVGAVAVIVASVLVYSTVILSIGDPER